MRPTLLSSSAFQALFRSFLAPTLMSGSALVISKLLESSFDVVPLFLSTAAVALSAIFGGWVSGVVALIFSTLGLAYLIFDPIYSFEVIGRDGIVRLFFFNLVGMVLCWVGSASRHARLRAEALLQELRKERELREMFISGLSHDLRNPLSAARTGTELLERNGSSGEQHQKLVKMVITSIDRVDQMIQDLLSVNRLRRGQKLIFPLEDCDLLAVVGSSRVDLQACKLEYSIVSPK